MGVGGKLDAFVAGVSGVGLEALADVGEEAVEFAADIVGGARAAVGDAAEGQNW